MKNQTAAEKFDQVPPWCVVKKGETWFGVEHVGGDFRASKAHGPLEWYPEPVSSGDWSEPEARRIARLTSPLDSWEPPADCPLPVEGWEVVQQRDGERRWEIHNAGGELASNCSYNTRRDAIVWAWKEAPAPADAKPRPITEADVRVGQVWKHGSEEYTRTVLDVANGVVCYKDEYSGKNIDTLSRFVWWVNEAPVSILITDSIAGRITPEADAQTDGKGRTLVEIDAKIDRECARIHELVRGLRADVDHAQHTADAANERIDKISGRVIDAEKNHRDLYDRVARNERLSNKTGRPLPSWPASEPAAKDPIAEVCHKLNMVRLSTIAETDTHITVNKRHWAELRKSIARLSAAQVAKPATLATRSDDASTNEVTTEAAAVDDGWREMLVPVTERASVYVWWQTPDGAYTTDVCDDEDGDEPDWADTSECGACIPVVRGAKIPSKFIDVRNRLRPPPNLAEWYKPKAAAFRDTAAVNADTLKDYDAACAAVPSTYRVGDDLAAWVRNLAAAHNKALKDMDEYRKQLASAHEAARQAAGLAHTATKRASKAEEELADLRGKVENLRAAFSG